MTGEHDAPDRPGASPDGLPPLRDVIRAHDLVAKKSLSQNFILDLNLTRRIARLVPLAGRTVVEVGPGPGGLTRALLLEGAERVVAIERDERCLAALAQIASHYQGRLDVHPGDALKMNWDALISSEQRTRSQPERPVIAANLPYAIATLLLVGWLETEPWPPWWGRMILMFQKEVAERIVATPGSKAYGRLSVMSQWRSEPRIALTLRPEAFTPPPKVASAVVDFVPRLNPVPACSALSLSRVTAAAFGQRRKMLRSSLKQVTPFAELWLQKAGIASERRGEELSVAEFGALALALDAGLS